jgi:hypothetical protein
VFNVPSVCSVRALLQEAVRSAAVTFGTRATEEWADGFSFTPEMRRWDAALCAKEGGRGKESFVCSEGEDAGAAGRSDRSS